MLEGFTLECGFDMLSLYCDTCCAAGELEPVFHEYADVVPLARIVTAAQAHRHTPPADTRRYDVFEACNGPGFVIWDRQEKRSLPGVRFAFENAAQRHADMLNKKEAA